jgi:hypothetical protein
VSGADDDRDERDLDEVRYHWGGAYVIARTGPGVWLAQRRDDRAVLRAESVAELAEAIRADYAARPVPRRDGGPWLP